MFVFSGGYSAYFQEDTRRVHIPPPPPPPHPKRLQIMCKHPVLVLSVVKMHFKAFTVFLVPLAFVVRLVLICDALSSPHHHVGAFMSPEERAAVRVVLFSEYVCGRLLL